MDRDRDDRPLVPRLEPVPGAPLLLVRAGEPLLVASDVHLGLALPTPRAPRSEAGSAPRLASGLLEASKRTGARRVLLLGDVKDPIRGLPRHIRSEVDEFFGRLLVGGLSVEVVLGNHDVGLTRALPAAVSVHPADGLLREGVGYFHGHAWPSRAILRRAGVLVAGHLHPGFRLAPSPERARTGKEPCWVRTLMRPLTPAERRRKGQHPPPRAREMIVLPAYNPLCASEALNREEPRRGHRFLVRRFLARGVSRAYLLDGTDLGELHWDLPPTTRGSAPGASLA